MKFGLFYELSTPRPFTRENHKAVYENALEQIVLAEELGFASVWSVEHHFLEEYSHASCPEMFLTAASRMTSKIRLGFGIATCVPEFHHPIRWAEKAAVLDILSGGRVEFGTGRSSTWNELGGFNATIDDTKKTWTNTSASSPKCGPRNVSVIKASTTRCRNAMSYPNPGNSRIRRCGWR